MQIAQMAIVEPFAQQLADWDRDIDRLSQADLDALESACAAATTTNCWVYTFRAAQMLLPMIRSSKHRRSVANAATGASHSSGEREGSG